MTVEMVVVVAVVVVMVAAVAVAVMTTKKPLYGNRTCICLCVCVNMRDTIFILKSILYKRLIQLDYATFPAVLIIKNYTKESMINSFRFKIQKKKKNMCMRAEYIHKYTYIKFDHRSEIVAKIDWIHRQRIYCNESLSNAKLLPKKNSILTNTFTTHFGKNRIH